MKWGKLILAEALFVLLILPGVTSRCGQRCPKCPNLIPLVCLACPAGRHNLLEGLRKMGSVSVSENRKGHMEVGLEKEFTSPPPTVSYKTDTFPMGGPALGWKGHKMKEALSVLWRSR